MQCIYVLTHVTEVVALLAQAKYNFKAHVYKPAGFETKKDYQAKHGSDLFITDVEEYDRICKVLTLSIPLFESYLKHPTQSWLTMTVPVPRKLFWHERQTA